MGIGPLIAWRRSSSKALIRTLKWPLGASIVAGAALIAIGAGSSIAGLIGYTFCVFVLSTIVVELVRGTRATGSLFELVARNRRRYGGYVVHASIVLLAIGIIGTGVYGTTKEVALKPGQSLQMPGYKLTYEQLKAIPSVTESGTTTTDRGFFKVSGRFNGTMHSDYVNSTALGPSHNVGIHTNWSRAEDLYVIFDSRVNKTGNAFYVKVLVKPLVNLIWIAGYLFFAGSLVAMWPDAREQRRLVSRLALARA
jgi:cytochrome c-type biogenesis protein CcmF